MRTALGMQEMSQTGDDWIFAYRPGDIQNLGGAHGPVEPLPEYVGDSLLMTVDTAESPTFSLKTQHFNTFSFFKHNNKIPSTTKRHMQSCKQEM